MAYLLVAADAANSRRAAELWPLGRQRVTWATLFPFRLPPESAQPSPLPLPSHPDGSSLSVPGVTMDCEKNSQCMNLNVARNLIDFL